MTTERIGPHGVPAPLPADAGARPAPGAADDGERSPSFRALLESLQRFAQQQPAAETPEDPDALRSAIERVDGDYEQVMDLRRRLEDAFRARTR